MPKGYLVTDYLNSTNLFVFSSPTKAETSFLISATHLGLNHTLSRLFCCQDSYAVKILTLSRLFCCQDSYAVKTLLLSRVETTESRQ